MVNRADTIAPCNLEPTQPTVSQFPMLHESWILVFGPDRSLVAPPSQFVSSAIGVAGSVLFLVTHEFVGLTFIQNWPAVRQRETKRKHAAHYTHRHSGISALLCCAAFIACSSICELISLLLSATLFVLLLCCRVYYCFICLT